MIILALLKGMSLWRCFAQPSGAAAAKIRATTGIRKTGNIRKKDVTKANGLKPKPLRFDLIASTFFFGCKFLISAAL
jgi:hypothetical protein